MEPYNPKILAIILRQYFCNINNLTEEEVLSYYFTFSSLVNADSEITWDEIGDNYLIWKPFESACPCDVLENMDALYFDITNTLNLCSPNIVINPLEVSATIADDYVKDYFTELGQSGTYIDDDGSEHFNDEAQELFISHNDYVNNLLYELKL